ncbi:uncharacterized protein LOC115882255 isoform X2 [Sitophilus oryzae]|uniref:Uncharacterized protein LOC115882255 isoform X2 n=1 Tax=Sitophilus oryzae TaxID=7048 RepID=A0A6J2XZF0_SITOR|nr:uncharacterized protein LOC115882255 isoform X2 [Sitophilus oryzae]
MDLLETVLRTCDSVEFIDKFRKNNINYKDLKLLNNEDLLLLEICDKETRNKILSRSKNMQLHAEQSHNFKINGPYLCLILNQISIHLNKHFANTSYFSKSVVDLANVKLEPICISVNNCLLSLENVINEVELNVGSLSSNL